MFENIGVEIGKMGENLLPRWII
jgi:hypothetical protein